jgi:hypothetical protein
MPFQQRAFDTLRALSRNSPMGVNQMFADRVAQDRSANYIADIGRRPSSPSGPYSMPRTVLPSREWDSFFGALQAQPEMTGTERLRVDFGGTGIGSGTGFGRWKLRDEGSGRTDDLSDVLTRSDAGVDQPFGMSTADLERRSFYGQGGSPQAIRGLRRARRRF